MAPKKIAPAGVSGGVASGVVRGCVEELDDYKVAAQHYMNLSRT